MREVEFIEKMISHHQSGLEVANLGVENAGADFVRDFCHKLQRGHQTEINFLVSHLKKFHNVIVEPLADESYKEDIDVLRDLKGTNFDKKFLAMMIGHHRDMIKMIKDENYAIYHDEVRELLKDVMSQQSSEIADMEYYQEIINK